MKKQSIRLICALAFVLLLAMTLVGCVTVPQQTGTTGNTTTEPVESTTGPAQTTAPLITYEVTFKGDNNTAPVRVEVKEGETVARPEDPERPGFTFLGWFCGNEEFDFNTPITQSITIIAKWSELPPPATYTVVFVDYDGTVLKTETVQEGQSATAPQKPSRYGYTFTGWDIAYTNVQSDLTVVAQYVEKATYQVVFMAEGVAVSTQTVYQGEAAIAPNPPTVENKVFSHWDASFTYVTGDLVVNAVYVPFFTVTFLNYDGTLLEAQIVGQGKTAIAPAVPARPQYTFVGWDVDFTNVQSDLTVTACFELTRYTVTFNTNGGGTIADVVVLEGETVARPADPVRNGYDFVEWRLNGSAYNFNAPVTANITLVAAYKSNGTVPAPDTNEVYLDIGFVEIWPDITVDYMLFTEQTVLSGSTLSKLDIRFEAANFRVEYITTDSSVCTVDQNGNITGRGVGEAVVYAVVKSAGEMYIEDVIDTDGNTTVRVVSLPVGTVLQSCEVKVVDQPDYYKLYLSEENQKITLGSSNVDVSKYASYPTGGYGSANITLWYGDTEGVFTMTSDDNHMEDFGTWNDLKETYGIPSTYMVISRYAHEVGSFWAEQVPLGHAVEPHGHFHMASSQYGKTSNSRVWMDFYYGKKDIEDTTGNQVLIMGYPCGYNDPDYSKVLFIAGRGTGGYVNTANKMNYNCTGSYSGFGSGVLNTMEQISNGQSLGAWISVHYHQIGSGYETTKSYFEAISEYIQGGYIWAATFPAAAQYGQERDTATLTMLSAGDDVMVFDLTDQMNDLLFTHALTVRIQADDSWKYARAYQNGKEMPVSIVEKDGKTYLLVDAVPDQGEVTVVKTNTPVVEQTEDRITYTPTDAVGTHNDKPLTMSFTVNGDVWVNAYAMQNGVRLPATLTTVKDVTTLTVTAVVNGGEVVVVPVTNQYAGRDTLSMTEIFKGEVSPDATRPITVSSPEELMMFSAYVNDRHDCAGLTVVLTQDIDLSSVVNFEPIGWELHYEKSSGIYEIAPFSGTFDGQGFKVTNLHIDSSLSMIGFFGFVKGGTIKNLSVEGSVSGHKRVGGIVGHGQGAVLENCVFTGSVTNYGINAHVNTGSMTGGLCGNLAGSTITNCAAYADVVSYAPSATSHLYTDQGDSFSSGNYTGGLVGSTYTSKAVSGGTMIYNSVFEGNVTAHKASDGRGALYVGGFIGNLDTGKIYNCTATATVKGGTYVGGFAGRQDGSTRDAYIYNCSSHGEVYGEEYVGGLCGLTVGTRRATNHNSFTDAKVYAPATAQYVGAIFGGLRGGAQDPAPIVYYVPSVNGTMVPLNVIVVEGAKTPTYTLNSAASPEAALEGLNTFATKNGYNTWMVKGDTISSTRFPIFTVSFLGKDGELLSTVSVPDGMSATAPTAPELVGFRFLGWDKAFDSVTANLTVRALYEEIITHTVTFYGENGTVISTQTINHGAAAVAPEAPAVAGKLFSGWSVDFSQVTSDLEVRAQYVTAYTVTFLGKDGEVLKTEKVKHGEGATAPTPTTYEEYRFLGWDTSFEAVTGDLTVKAQYQQLTLYTVTFLGKDGSTLASIRVEAGAAATAPSAPSIEGFRFTGWDKDFSNVQGNMTVKAQYIEVLSDKVIMNVQSWHVTGDKNTSFSSKMDAFTAMWNTADVVIYSGTYGVDLPAGLEGWAQQTADNTTRHGSVGYGQAIAWRTDKYSFDENAGVYHVNSSTKWLTDAALFAVPLVDNATGKQVIVVSVFFGGGAKLHESSRLINSFRAWFETLTTKYADASAIVLNIQTQSGVSGVNNQGMANTFSGLDTSAWFSGYDLAVSHEYQISGTAYSRYVGTYLNGNQSVTISGAAEIPTTGDYATQNGNSYTLTIK